MQRQKRVALVMYDLPVKTAHDQRISQRFRKYLRNHGYVFLQKSVYAKLFRSSASMKQDIILLRGELPEEGTVQVLPLCMDDFQKMTTILGRSFPMAIFADDVVCI